MIVIHSLSGGGASLYLTLLLKYLDMSQISPKVVVFSDVMDHTLPSNVEVTCLHKKGVLDYPFVVLKLARIIRKEKPDMILSIGNISNIVSGLAHKLGRIKNLLIYSEHISPQFTAASANHKLLTPLKKCVANYIYPRSSVIIAVCKGVKEGLVKDFNVSGDKIKVIYNGLDLNEIRRLAEEPVSHPWFNDKTQPVLISIGRLYKQKGYPYLLRAFSIARKIIPCRLIILGKGEERSSLEQLSSDLGISDSVCFLGFQENPYKFLSRSDVFVLSSLWEGFGYVIVEAMVCGIPVISTKCPSGPDEIISDKLDGILVPPANEGALAEAIISLLRNSELRAELSIKGQKRAEYFGIERWKRELEGLLLSGN
jgi:glycosyltransferase involved in cell wall biosynthesis